VLTPACRPRFPPGWDVVTRASAPRRAPGTRREQENGGEWSTDAKKKEVENGEPQGGRGGNRTRALGSSRGERRGCKTGNKEGSAVAFRGDAVKAAQPVLRVGKKNKKKQG
jgi:hypothetical protein